MVILGVDPGTATTGFALIKKGAATWHFLDCGVIETDKAEKSEIRLLRIFEALERLIKEGGVAELALESVFFNSNAKTALLVGQATGVIKLAAAKADLPLWEYTPLQVKIALTGYGRAEKSQVGEMVKKVLHLKSVPKPDDAADAAAIALCHAYSRKLKSLQR